MVEMIPHQIDELYVKLTNHAEEVHAFLKIRGAAPKILGRMNNNMLLTCSLPPVWNLHAVTCVKSIVVIKDKADKVKGMAEIVVNAGAGNSFLEMLGDLMFVTSRTHQIGAGRLECNPIACPGVGEGGEEGRKASIELAKQIAKERLLVKNEQRLASERCTVSQSVAFNTARKITNHADQKSIIRDWKERGNEGRNAFKNKRSGFVLKEASSLAGIDIDGIEEGGGKKKERRGVAVVG